MEPKTTTLQVEYLDDKLEQYEIEVSEEGEAIGHHEGMFFFDTQDYCYFINMDHVRKLYILRDKQLEAEVRAKQEAERSQYLEQQIEAVVKSTRGQPIEM